MEDEKLAAYYDDLTRRGSGASRFKQGLGFSSKNDDVPSRGSALPTTSSSFLSSFVKASSPSKTSEFEKQAQLLSIQNKLSQKPKEETRSRSPSRNSTRRSRSRSPSRDRIRDKRRSRSRSQSPSRDRIREKHSRRRSRDRYSRRRSQSRERRSRRSRSRDHGSRAKYRSRSRSRENNREKSKRQGLREERRSEKDKKRPEVPGGGGIDFTKLIDGYESMTPAERVKAKMKLQLSKTADNDEAIGKGSGWERFDFDKDAPLDDEEIEAAEDDKVLVNQIGQSFRFTAVEARKEEAIKAAHDEAMFGASSYRPPADTDDEAEGENHIKENDESNRVASLLSDQVLTMKQGSWRDRARKP